MYIKTTAILKISFTEGQVLQRLPFIFCLFLHFNFSQRYRNGISSFTLDFYKNIYRFSLLLFNISIFLHLFFRTSHFACNFNQLHHLSKILLFSFIFTNHIIYINQSIRGASSRRPPYIKCQMVNYKQYMVVKYRMVQ